MKLCIEIEQNEYGAYVAVCPCLPGCVTKGRTREQAKEKLEEAIRGYLAAMGDFVPDELVCQVTEV